MADPTQSEQQKLDRTRHYAQKFQIFKFFPSQKNLIQSGQKVSWSEMGWPLIYCRSKARSCQIGSGFTLRQYLVDCIIAFFDKIFFYIIGNPEPWVACVGIKRCIFLMF